MNREYMNLFLEKTAFPSEAVKTITSAADVLATELDQLLDLFHIAYDVKAVDALIDPVAEGSGISKYTIWLAVLILASEKAKALYPDEQVFWDTFTDLRYKAYECMEIHGVWGNFVAFWYPIFYRGRIVKLGRLEFETIACPLGEPVSLGGITVNPGQRIFSVHIPSSGEPFTPEARLDSYRRAFEYFRPEEGVLICQCHSWLLYPGYDAVLPADSNIRKFAREFFLMGKEDTEEFNDAWRVFGWYAGEPVENLPENTALRRALKAHLLAGGKVGMGQGALLFDGNRILTAHE